MFKRVRWMGMGAVAGVGASAWAQHRLRRTLQDHPSIQTGAGLLAGARRVARDVGAAVADGRLAMNQREAVLRADLDRRHEGPDRAVRPEPSGPAVGRYAPGRPDLRVVNATFGTSHPAGPGQPGGPDRQVHGRARRRQDR